ncbi:MAG: ribosome-binding protein aMBF1 (putative translation factor) [Maribacter sp.]|jgi:ribosome-binding protein aMBF1 (putative translation factor)
MNKSSLFLLLFCLLGSFSLSAQTEINEQKTYTYQEAVELLTAQQGDFVTKGIAPPLLSMGDQIRMAREDREISISTLAYISGLKEDILVKIEANRVTPTRDILAKIESFLGTEIVLTDNN